MRQSHRRRYPGVLAIGLGAVALAGAVAMVPTPARAATTLYVATNGSDSNAGSLAAPGGTIAVRGGTYALTTNIQITRSGTAGAPLTLTNYQSEKVVIDGEALPFTPGAVGSTIPSAQRGAIHMQASWWKLVGLEIEHGP